MTGTRAGSGMDRLRETSVDGRARAVNILTPFNTWWGRVWRTYAHPFGVFRAFDWIGFRWPERFYPFRGMGVIHFLSWAVIRELPYLGGGQAREHLKHSYLLFASCYNGDAHEYLDVFSDGIDPRSIEGIWGDTPHFVPSRPVTPWKDKIFEHVFETQYFYSAYEDASAADVRAGRRVLADLQRFEDRRAKGSIPAGAFAPELTALVRRHQGNLGLVERNVVTEREEGSDPAGKRSVKLPRLATAGGSRPTRPGPLTALVVGAGLVALVTFAFAIWAWFRIAMLVVAGLGAAALSWNGLESWVAPHRRHPHHGLVYLTPIVEGQREHLLQTLARLPEDRPFDGSPATHMARFAVLQREDFRRSLDPDEPAGLQNDYLFLHLVADARVLSPPWWVFQGLLRRRNSAQYIETLAAGRGAGSALERIYRDCVAYPLNASPRELSRYLERSRIRTVYTYRDAHARLAEVRQALRAHAALRALAVVLAASDATTLDEGQLRERFDEVLEIYRPLRSHEGV